MAANALGALLFLTSTLSGTATEGPVLRGVVLDEDERPLQGAVVLAAPRNRSFGEQPRSAKADDSGRFELALGDASQLFVTVFADGFVPFHGRDVDVEKPLRVALSRGNESLEGFVRDGNTRDPIEGALVEARAGAGPGLFLSSNPRLGLVEATTDARGAFRLAGIGPGPKSISASAPGYGRSERTASPGEPAELFLFPGTGIYGIVIGLAHEPVPGALVSLRGPIRGSRNLTPQETDDSGRFAFLGVEPGEYQVLAQHTDHAPSVVSNLRVDADRDVEITVTLTPGAFLRGRVVDFEGEPLEADAILTRLDGEVVDRRESASLSVHTATDGAFELSRVPPGEHELTVRARGYAPSRIPVSITRSGGDEDLGDLALEPGLSIRGRVVSESGAGVAGVRILGYLRSPRETFVPDFGMLPETLSESDGSFVLSGLEEGTYYLSAVASGVGQSDGVTVDAGDENVRLVLQAVGSVQGTVVDSRGGPVSGLQALLHRGDGFRRRTFGGTGNAAGAPGALLIEDVVVGEYVLDVTAPGFARSVVSDVVVKPGAVTSVGTLRLSRGGSVRGTVVDPGGTPVAGARVRAADPGVRRFGPFGQNETTTGAEGAFELAGLSEGSIELVASHPNFAEGRANASIDADAVEPVVHIRLSPGGRIEGTVRSRRIGPVSGRSVLVLPTTEGPRRFDGLERKVEIDPDGYFAVDGLPAGRAQVLLLAGGGHFQSSIQSREVEIRDGETTWVEFESSPVHVQGIVRKGGSPLGGLEIVLSSEDVFGFTTLSMERIGRDSTGPQIQRAVTLDDGYYELLVDRPGTYRVRANVRGAGLPQKTVTIPDVDVFTLDIDYGGAGISGRVVDAETGAPLGDASVGVSPKEPRGGREGAWMDTGSDGTFALEVDPGTYVLGARAMGYGARELTLAVGAEGRSDIVMALSKGLAIQGVLRNGQGRPAGNVRLYAVPDDPDPVPVSGISGFGTSLPDGSYVVSSLSSGRYNVFASDGSGAFAFAPGIEAGSEGVDLAFLPGGKATVLARDESGAPVSNAIVAVIAIQGRKVRGLQSMGDGSGRLELPVPAGSLLLKSAKGIELEGLARIDVRPGEHIPVEIVLRPK